MTSFRTIRLDIDRRGVATLELARPDKHNAMDAAMIAELASAALTLADDGNVRVVVLASSGRSFCAGGDLGWMRAQMEADRTARIAESEGLARMLAALDALPQPLLARVHGPAYGGGVGLFAVADIVLAAPGARFALTETKLGLLPANIGPYVIRRIGEGHARRCMLHGRPFGAEEACRIGLVSRVVDAGELDAAVGEEVAQILQCAPGAIAATKRLIAEMSGHAPADRGASTARLLADRWETDEAREGIAAFFSRVAPPWVPERK